ncbi:hypothetical protein [Schauerella aestuarii]|uniref:hypothetical protein n=1 Tax=Schauerella aestuarii TaxID=2511204 RepID=UPI0013691D18|nr:hypothetical protein [Achromobacter aestuarii]MYZ44188.1 hypothetical protein [Achromobacter aestuarii]
MPKQSNRLSSDGISTPETLSAIAQDVNTSSAESVFTAGRTHLEAQKAWIGLASPHPHLQDRAAAINTAASTLRVILSLITEAPAGTIDELGDLARENLYSHLSGIAFDIELMSDGEVWSAAEGVLS